jgi:hypothetical protein
MKRSAVIVFALAVVGLTAAPALAQDTTPGERLGGYDVQASSMVASFQPVFPALLPTGDAPIEATLGLSTGRVKSGGNAFGRASIIWPGNAAADPGPLFGQLFGPEIGALFPKWPLQAEADQQDGEVIAGAPPGVSMKAVGFPDLASGDVRTADINAPGLVHAEHIASTAETKVFDASASSVARATLEGVSLFGGYITVEQIRSISRTTSNGSSAKSSGDVDVVGMRIGGIDVSVTDDGFKVTGVPPDAQEAPGAGGEPFPGQSPEKQVQQVLASIGARITLFQGVGRTAGGQAQHFELGLVFSIDNPVGGQGPIPPGHFDLIVGSTSSQTLASSPFSSGASGFGASGSGSSGSVSSSPRSVSIGGGPAPAGTSVSGVGEELGGATGGTGTPELAFGDTPRRVDYRFKGVPRGMFIGLLLAALLAAYYLRNFFNSIIAAKTERGET